MRDSGKLIHLKREAAGTVNSLFSLMDKQVKSYHKMRKMNSTSVPTELARELLLSLEYTLRLVDVPYSDLEEQLMHGQVILEKRYGHAMRLFQLVEATNPEWQGESRWEAICNIRKYLETYDFRHLAHKTPELLCYPFIQGLNSDLLGIDYVLEALRFLQIENQVIAVFPSELSETFWSVFCQDDRGLTENQCEQLILNALGKLIIGDKISALPFSSEELEKILQLVSDLSEEQLEMKLNTALDLLLSPLSINDSGILAYAHYVVKNILPRLMVAIQAQNLHYIFI